MPSCGALLGVSAGWAVERGRSVRAYSTERRASTTGPVLSDNDRMATPVTVERNEAKHRFEAKVGDEVASLVYRDRTNCAFVLVHTEVPEGLRGQGLANQLAKAALEYARSSGRRVVVVCPFVKAFLERHPEYR